MKEWLKDFPTQSLVTVTGCLLALLTGLFYFVAEMKKVDLDDTTFGLWLAFVAGMLGFAYMGFAKKRDTWVPTEPDGKDATDVEDTTKKAAALPAGSAHYAIDEHDWAGVASVPSEPVNRLGTAELAPTAAEQEERELAGLR